MARKMLSLSEILRFVALTVVAFQVVSGTVYMTSVSGSVARSIGWEVRSAVCFDQLTRTRVPTYRATDSHPGRLGLDMGSLR